MRFKIDLASLIVRSKFTVFALFYLRAIFQVQAPKRGGGGGGGVYFWGAFYRGGFTSEFYGIPRTLVTKWNYTWRSLEIACNKLSSIK